MVPRTLTFHFSIIAVHGLQGDWERTWEEDGKIWLRDFLGKKIDRVQVLSFGYNSIIASSGWAHELEHFSAQLLQNVKNHLDTEQVVSTVFRAQLQLTYTRKGLALSFSWVTVLEVSLSKGYSLKWPQSQTY
jgi:hypothetical protein